MEGNSHFFFFSSSQAYNDDQNPFIVSPLSPAPYTASSVDFQYTPSGIDPRMAQQHSRSSRSAYAFQNASLSPSRTPWMPPQSHSPPPIPQEVFILDCKSCDTFLTNRGMSAVLLLQPDVSLYSSDALPANCSVCPGTSQLSPQYQVLQQQSTTNLRYVCPSGMSTPVPRTCECLTQTLCCHGCGTAVGYMVVIPCRRCSSSITPTDQHIARHRFVFFNKEIKASMRHYIPDEPGVMPYPPSPFAVITSPVALNPSSSTQVTPSSRSRVPFGLLQELDYHTADAGVSHLLAPALEQSRIGDYRPAYASSPNAPHGAQSSQYVMEELKSQRGKLRDGDVLYWHNLAKTGEIPAVADDERARRPYSSAWVLAGR